MNIKIFLFGIQFLRLIQEGRQIDKLIKNGGVGLLKKSTPEQESALNIQWYRLSRPNPFSVGITLMLLAVSVPWGWGSIIDYFDLPIPSSAILSLSIVPFLSIYASFIPYTLGRGYISGLLLTRHFYLFNIFLTLSGFCLILIKSIVLNAWMKQLYTFPLQLLVIYLCRYTINSNSFYKTISFSRTTRLLVEAKKAREKLQSTK
ncbi:hypothetical protein [Enterobacter cloacae]|uniref:hypothetical protein n=1 Tax=Enterobacter cloacae TaxID=550 RepID=UPI002A800D5F|nr:hypothetical protein [Enterobacter cloacae]